MKVSIHQQIQHLSKHFFFFNQWTDKLNGVLRTVSMQFFGGDTDIFSMALKVSLSLSSHYHIFTTN